MNSTLPNTVTENTGKLVKTFGYYAAFIVLGLVTGVFGPTLADLAHNTQTTLNQISIIFAVRSLGYLTGSFLAGRLYDRVRGHPLIATVLLATAIAFFLIPTIPLLWLLIFIMIALGIAEGGIDVGGNSLIVWVHGARVGPFMNGLHFFFGIGAFISPIIVAQVVLTTGEFRWAYWLLAMLTIPIAFAFLRLPSPAIQHLSQHAEHARANAPLVALIAVLLFIYVGAETGYGNWIFTYATRLNLANATDAALLTATFWGSFTLGRLLGIAISTRAQPARILLVDLLGCLASVSMILVFPQSTFVLWLATFGAGIFLASVFPTVFALAGERLTITAKVTGWFMVGGGLGAMFFPWLIGQLIEPLGAQVLIGIVVVSVVIDLALLLILLLMPREKIINGG